MNDSYFGGINITDVLEALNAKHSAFTKDNNGKIWMNITAWVSAQPDRYGNSISISLNSKQHGNEKRKYIGNLKKNIPKERSITDSDVAQARDNFSSAINNNDDLPF